MSGFNQKHSTPPFTMAKIYRSLLATSIVAAGAPVAVQAQEEVNQIEEVVVRGSRAALRSAAEPRCFY